MASFQESDGLDLLVHRYCRLPDGPCEVVRHTTVSIAAQYYNAAEFVDKWEDWLVRASRTNDSWLWYHGQCIRARHGQLDGVLQDIQRQRDHFLKAASIEALGAAARTEALELIPQILGERNRGNRLQQDVIIEACASVINRMRHELGTELYMEAATHVIEKLDNRRVQDRTRLVIARYLREIFNEAEAHDDVHAWMRLLERGEPNRERPEDSNWRMRVTPIGDRIAFLIDFSDAMLTPLTEAEREALRGPENGNRANGNGDDEMPAERLTNRFELAREEIKRKIAYLPEDIFFTVIVFGDEAQFLNSTPHLVQATARHKSAAITELDGYESGPATPNDPQGTLLGGTNLHGALLKAFRATKGEVLRNDEHVDERGITDGVDTIYVLSGGPPSVDDYIEVDRRELEEHANDSDTTHLRYPPGDGPHKRYPGPYVRPLHEINHLLEDIYRMNLHRKAEIHTIGIGEYDADLLEAIARIGRGTFRSITGRTR